MADQAAKAGDTAKATEYTRAAETIATQLVEVEAQVEDLKTMRYHHPGVDQAKAAVAANGQLASSRSSPSATSSSASSSRRRCRSR